MHVKHFLLGLGTIAVFVIFLSTTAKAQTFGVGVSPEISYRNLVKTDFVPGIDEFIDETNDISESTFGYTAGAYFLKPFGRNLFFETGATISLDGYDVVLSDLDFEDLITQGLINSDDPGFDATEEIEFRNRFHSVGIPLRLVFMSGGEKVRFIWGLGITPEYLFNSYTETIYKFDFGEEERFEGEFQSTPADFNLTASISAGVDISLDRGRQSFVRIEPILRYGVLPVFDEDAYEINLFSYGLSLKYFFDLNIR